MTKTNPHRGEVSLSLAGRKYKLVPSYAGLSAIEAASGEGLIQFTRKLAGEGYRLSDLAEIVAALAEPEITPEDAGVAIAEAGIMGVAEVVASFLIQVLMGGEAGKAPAAKGK